MDTTLPSRTPIFTDQSGRRARTVQWLARGLCGSLIVVAGAVAFTLVTHVPLPGLDRILSPRTHAEAGQTMHQGATASRSTLGLGLDLGAPPRGTTTTAHLPAVATIAGTELTTTSGHLGSVSAPLTSPVPAAATSHSAAATPTAKSDPHAAAKGASSANPRSAAKGKNSSPRSTSSSTKSANPRAVTARTKAKPSRGQAAVARGSKK